MRTLQYAACIGFLTTLCVTSCHKNSGPTAPSPVKVEVMVPQETQLSQSAAYSGTVEASAASVLSFCVAGTVNNINVEEGQMISKGQLIGQVDNTSLRHAWEISNDALSSAQDTYDRMKKLYDSNSLPEMRWVEVKNALASAMSAEKIARKAMNDASLYSPVEGYVAEKIVQAGTNVAMGQPVVRIVSINPIKVNISVPENDMTNFEVGQEGIITVDALGGERFQGKVVEKGVTANPLSRAYSIKLIVNNAKKELLPGMVCEVNMECDSALAKRQIVLPTNSVLLDADNSNFVWLAKDGRAAKRIVETGGFAKGGIVIASGLSSQDTVIIKGQQKVSQNTPISYGK